MSYYILDCETTGITSSDQIIELAYFRVVEDTEKFKNYSLVEPLDNWVFVGGFNYWHDKLYKPSVPIHPKAQEVHGISYKELIKCPPSSSIKLPENICALIGHNISFDWRMLGKPNVSLICTMKLAKKAWPKNNKGITYPENYQLETLIRFLYPKEADRLLDRKFHRAMDDCKLCYYVLVKILEHYKKVEHLEQLVKICNL